MRKIDTIIIHCSDTPSGMDIGVEDITRWHKDRGFDTIGYHYVIRRNGILEKGRDIAIKGAHAQGHNSTSIGICIVGGMGANRQPENNFTEAQCTALKRLVTTLKFEYGIKYVIGHSDVSVKACPCFNVKEWLEREGI